MACTSIEVRFSPLTRARRSCRPECRRSVSTVTTFVRHVAEVDSAGEVDSRVYRLRSPVGAILFKRQLRLKRLAIFLRFIVIAFEISD
jgi:hypothetical protein